MRKYFTLLYITFSVMSFAQFTDNVYPDKAASTNQQQSSNSNVTESEISPNTFTPNEEDRSASIGGHGDEQGRPGNPGEPVPINEYVSFLLLAGLILIVYYQIKNKKINI